MDPYAKSVTYFFILFSMLLAGHISVYLSKEDVLCHNRDGKPLAVSGGQRILEVQQDFAPSGGAARVLSCSNRNPRRSLVDGPDVTADLVRGDGAPGAAGAARRRPARSAGAAAPGLPLGQHHQHASRLRRRTVADIKRAAVAAGAGEAAGRERVGHGAGQQQAPASPARPAPGALDVQATAQVRGRRPRPRPWLRHQPRPRPRRRHRRTRPHRRHRRSHSGRHRSRHRCAHAAGEGRGDDGPCVGRRVHQRVLQRELRILCVTATHRSFAKKPVDTAQCRKMYSSLKAHQRIYFFII